MSKMHNVRNEAANSKLNLNKAPIIVKGSPKLSTSNSKVNLPNLRSTRDAFLVSTYEPKSPAQHGNQFNI